MGSLSFLAAFRVFEICGGGVGGGCLFGTCIAEAVVDLRENSIIKNEVTIHDDMCGGVVVCSLPVCTR